MPWELRKAKAGLAVPGATKRAVQGRDGTWITVPLPNQGGKQSPALALQVPNADLQSLLSCVGPCALSQIFILSSCSGLETRVSPSTSHSEDLTEPPDSWGGTTWVSSKGRKHPPDPSPPLP